MSGKLKFYSEKLAGYKKFYSIVGTIKKIALSKYQVGVMRTKTRDYTLRYSKKAFGNSFGEKDETELCQLATLYVTCGTNRGNCGPINSAKYRYIKQILESEDPKNVKILPIGKKGNDSVSRLFPDLYTYSLLNDDKYSKSIVWANYVSENLDAAFEGHDRIQVCR